MKRAVSLCSLLALFPLSCFASGVQRTTITNLQISKAYGDFVFIQVSGVPLGSPACENSGWNYTLSLSSPGDSQLYAMLLTAYTSGALINIEGAGTCNEVGFVESLQTLQLTQ
jgi:hypothetical protein